VRKLFALALALGAFSLFAADECPPRYSYSGFAGPSQWPNIPFEGQRNECGGTSQSPVDLENWTETKGPAVIVKYTASGASIKNTGHDIEVIPDRPMTITIDGAPYTLRQFHFHVPSEHLIRGTRAAAEIHFVNDSADRKSVAAIAVLISADGMSSGLLGPVIQNMPMNVCAPNATVSNFPFDRLLPSQIDTYVTYGGSLTTPPCNEVVTFYIVQGAGLALSPTDFSKLASLGSNSRPPQPLGARQIKLVSAPR
jgi:carbonic anhydrase